MKLILTWSCLIAAGALLCSCAQEAPDEGGYPPPGAMRVVSMERIEQSASTQSLLPNGDFAQWWAGAPVPNGFQAPAPDDSSIGRETIADKMVMVQQWKQNSATTLLASMLRAESMPLVKGRRYRVRITAASPAGRVAMLGLWQQNDQAVWQPLVHHFLTLQPAAHGVKTYQKDFTAERDGPVALAASSVGAETGENPAVWVQWELVEAAV